MKIFLAWYSRTETTTRVAKHAGGLLSDTGHEVAECRLQPTRSLPYPAWLALSFIPGSRFPLSNDVPDLCAFDACILATPKWTFSCPPVNQFLHHWGAHLPPTAVLLTYGGWDQERYLNSLKTCMSKIGIRILGVSSWKKT